MSSPTCPHCGGSGAPRFAAGEAVHAQHTSHRAAHLARSGHPVVGLVLAAVGATHYLFRHKYTCRKCGRAFGGGPW
jgi:hypothetical protein